MRFFKAVLGVILLLCLSSCSINTEPKVISVTPNKDLLAQFAFEDSIYSIEGNTTPSNKIIKDVGEIDKMVEDIENNGEGKSFSAEINSLVGTKIYTVQDVDKDTVIAVKMNDLYYTAIFTRKLE